MTPRPPQPCRYLTNPSAWPEWFRRMTAGEAPPQKPEGPLYREIRLEQEDKDGDD